MSQDDWHSEIKDRLSKDIIYNTLKVKCDVDSSGPQVLSLVEEATYYAYQKTKTILRHMGEFTLHDGEHLFRVLTLMGKLLSKEQIECLSVPELMLLVLSAFFHDVGMAPEEKAVLSWRKVWDNSPEFDDETDKDEFSKFQRYYLARPQQITQLNIMIKQGKNSDADLLKSYIISEYIRTTHAERARTFIKTDWLKRIKYRNTDLTVELANLCFSHNEDTLSILDLEINYLCGQDVYVNLQLVAVILRLSDLLDFDAKRTPSILFSHLFVRHPISIAEWNKHRVVQAWSINSKNIQYHAKCDHPAIEASIHAFCDVIDNELRVCNNIITSINNFNSKLDNGMFVEIPLKMDRSKIETQKDIDGNPEYIYRQTQFNLSKTQVVELLMGTKLYGDPEVALRELLQNSIDACLLRHSMESSWGNIYSPEISIEYSNENEEHTIEIVDNGTGMDQHIIDTYYSKIGSSFYKSSEFYDLKSQSNSKFVPTSRFGIGILSSFMVADSLIVETRRVYGPHSSSNPIRLTIEGQDSIFWIKPGQRQIPGTSTKLFLRKDQNPWEKMTEEEFIQSVENVIPNPPFKMTIIGESQNRITDENSFKVIKAESLKNYKWENHNNIKEINLEFNDADKGFVGSAVVAILEHRGIPVSKIDMTGKSVEIDGSYYDLDKNIKMSGDEISLHTTSITIDADDQIDQYTSTTNLCESESKLSFHGINVPMSLFPKFYRVQKNQARLKWPFPMLIVVDICGNFDLDLNSSRTQILMSEKWTEFEEHLSFEICSGIAKSVSEKYWEKLKDILTGESDNEIFLESLNKVIPDG